ncbi:hypothetical protein DFH06DRAFT_1345275 [Mycena polygramma]|nr:hypothetical protein DFH06DRAFT_1345275 [Mycena polygramma]
MDIDSKAAIMDVSDEGTPLSSFGPLCVDTWTLIVSAFVHDPSVGPRELAVRKGIIACVAQGWKGALYDAPVFWSNIKIVKDMPVSALQFALSKIGDGDIHLWFSLVNFRRLGGRLATETDVHGWVDDRLRHLTPLSSHWRSFKLDTESPLVFTRIRGHCADLRAYSLVVFDVSYTYLPGHSLDVKPSVRLLPFDSTPWFRSVLPSMARLVLFCVPFVWASDMLFEGLEVVELSYSHCPITLPVDILPRLFTLATRLRTLRLGLLIPFDFPEGFILSSSSLQTFDIDFDSGPIVRTLLDALEVPSLRDMTVRDVRECVDYLFAFPILLNRLTHFRVHGPIGDRVSLQHLFAELRRIEFLDIAHSDAVVFETYLIWARTRARFNKSNYLEGLRTLHLPAVDLPLVVQLVNMVGETVFPEVGRLGVQRLRVERPLDHGLVWNSIVWLRSVIPDFAFTNMYSPSAHCSIDKLLSCDLVVLIAPARDSVLCPSRTFIGLDLRRHISDSTANCPSPDLLPASPSFDNLPVRPVCSIVSMAALVEGSPPAMCNEEGELLSLLDPSDKKAPKYNAPFNPDLPYLVEDVMDLVLQAFAADESLPFKLFIHIRGLLLRSSHWIRYRVRRTPAFWSKLLISPRPRLSLVHQWLELSSDSKPLIPLTISFSATRASSRSSSNEDLEFWVQDAAAILASQIDRCVSLTITTDSPELLTETLLFLDGSHAVILQSMVVKFGLHNYSYMRPHALHDFHFRELPPLGSPFRPFESLAWTVGPIHNPTVTYTTSERASCTLVHPAALLITWAEVVAVLASSLRLSTLLLDGLFLDYEPGTLTCTPPLSALRVLDVAFRGMDSMAQLVTRLNAPALRTLRISVTATADIQCLCACAALLSNIDELVLIGSCPSAMEAYSIYSLMHRATRLDLRMTTSLFYSAFAAACGLPPSEPGVNWNACPNLKQLLVHQIPLTELRSMLQLRIARGYPMLEYVCASEPAGGAVSEVVDWFSQMGVELVVVELQ